MTLAGGVASTSMSDAVDLAPSEDYNLRMATFKDRDVHFSSYIWKQMIGVLATKAWNRDHMLNKI